MEKEYKQDNILNIYISTPHSYVWC